MRKHPIPSSVLAFTLAGILLASGLGANVAEAYNNYDNPCRWWNTTPMNIYFDWGPNLQNPSYTWRLRFSDSVGDWNSIGTKPVVSWSSGSSNVLDSYTEADNNYGKTAITCVFGFMNRFVAYANSNYGPSYNWDNNFMRSVTGHELGHGLGLGHSTVSPAIMNTSRDRYTIYVPQTDDRDGLNSLYP